VPLVQVRDWQGFPAGQSAGAQHAAHAPPPPAPNVPAQYLSAPLTQPQVLAPQVKLAAVAPQSAGPLQQPPVDCAVYVHELPVGPGAVGQVGGFWQALAAAQSVESAQQVTAPEPPSSDGACTQLDTPAPATTHVSCVHGSPSLHSASIEQQLSASTGTHTWPAVQVRVSQAPTAGQSAAAEHDPTPWLATPRVGGDGLQAASANPSATGHHASLINGMVSRRGRVQSRSRSWRAA
jgi:hypothetical protein